MDDETPTCPHDGCELRYDAQKERWYCTSVTPICSYSVADEVDGPR